jgi:hypothetical protein
MGRRYRIDTATVEMIQQQDWPSEEDCEEWVTLHGYCTPSNTVVPRRINLMYQHVRINVRDTIQKGFLDIVDA